MHALPHRPEPAGQMQLPFTHPAPAGQTVPHWPQLAGSAARVTHPSGHCTCPAAQPTDPPRPSAAAGVPAAPPADDSAFWSLLQPKQPHTSHTSTRRIRARLSMVGLPNRRRHWGAPPRARGAPGPVPCFRVDCGSWRQCSNAAGAGGDHSAPEAALWASFFPHGSPEGWPLTGLRAQPLHGGAPPNY